jgi:predicted GIY-YIG superfamily endonuclease
MIWSAAFGEHKNGTVKDSTKQYKLDRLVYYEDCRDIRDAIAP